MAQVTLRGNALNTVGDLPAVGSKAPDFTLTGSDLGEVTLKELAGKNIVLNIFVSIDTPTCAASVRVFNERVTEVENTVVVCASADLPFAAGRFCGVEEIENVLTGSTFRNPEFLDDYGVRLVDGPVHGLAARAVVVIDDSGTVVHSQLVPEVSEEPDYDSALAALF